MKNRLYILFIALVATTALWAQNNVITYTATEKLRETTSSSLSGLHTNAFNVAITSHTFSNGTGTITFAGDVTTIGDDAFSGCSGLTSVTIPNSVTTIGSAAFYNCSRLASLVIPTSVTTIGTQAFSHCSSLASVTIPNSVKSIEWYTFEDCTGLTLVTIGSSVTTISEYAFVGCSNLRSFSVVSGNTQYLSLDGVLFNYDKTELIRYPIGKIGSTYSIPSFVTRIRDHAFSECSILTSVTISNSVKIIGYLAFDRCSGLISVTIGSSVITIGYNAFSGCSNLTSFSVVSGNTKYSSQDGVLFNYDKTELIRYPIGNSRSTYSIPSSVKTIGRDAFNECSRLTSVTIPNSVTTIEEYAFQDCIGLTSITIPNSVTTIGGYAFRGCSGLTSVTIPNSVASIGVEAFHPCSSLTSISVVSGNTKYSSQDGVLFNKAKTNLIQYPIGNSRSTYSIPSSVKTIGRNAFNECSRLTSVTIPKSVTTIEYRAFYDCLELISITIKCTTPPAMDWDVFAFLPSSCVFYIPCGKLSQYQSIWDYSYKLYESSYSLILQQNQHGTINNSSTISCSNNTAYLTATPDEHYHFVKWSDGNTTNPRTITITNDTTLSATFAPNTYSISANGTNGTIKGSGTYNYGDYATLLAIPTSGYEFIRWSDGEEYNPHIIYVENDLNLTAIFEPIQSALGEIKQDDIIAFTKANTLYVNDTKNPYTVYNSAGMIIYQGCAPSINLPASGMYIVKQNAITTKVITQ